MVGGEILLRAEFSLHPQDVFADLAAAVIDNRRLPVAVRFLQFLEQAAGKTELGERGLELIVVLEFLALLRGHVGLEKDFARVVRLGREPGGREGRDKNRRKESDRFFSCLGEAENSHVWLSCNA